MGSYEMSSVLPAGLDALAATTPMLIASGEEWLPTSGLLWQLVQVPTIGACEASLAPFSPSTAVMLNVRVLKTCSPRPIDCCCADRLENWDEPGSQLA